MTDNRRRVTRQMKDLFALPCVISFALPNDETFVITQPPLLTPEAESSEFHFTQTIPQECAA